MWDAAISENCNLIYEGTTADSVVLLNLTFYATKLLVLTLFIRDTCTLLIHTDNDIHLGTFFDDVMTSVNSTLVNYLSDSQNVLNFSSFAEVCEPTYTAFRAVQHFINEPVLNTFRSRIEIKLAREGKLRLFLDWNTNGCKDGHKHITRLRQYARSFSRTKWKSSSM